MLKKIFQIKALIKNYLLIEEIKYSLSVYRRVYNDELRTDILTELKKHKAEGIKLNDEGKDPENDEDYANNWLKIQRLNKIQAKAKKDQSSINEIKKKIEIIKGDLF